MGPGLFDVGIMLHLYRNTPYTGKLHLLLHIRGLYYLAAFGNFFLLFSDGESNFWLLYKKEQLLNIAISGYCITRLSKAIFEKKSDVTF